MAYGPLRFLYDNYVTEDMITASSWAPGRVSGSAKSGSGVATMTITGDYSGAYDLSYLREIDSIAGGQDVGESTFSWRNNLTAGTWEETGVLTRTDPPYPLSADGLGTGLAVDDIGGVGNDFELGDDWQWEARATYGAKNLLDRNPMTTWRTDGYTTATLTIDLGSAQTPTAALLQRHNLTPSATVKLQGNSSNVWTSPAFDYTFATITDALIYYFTAAETYQYWRWDFSDATNPDGYIEIALMFLGSYLQLNKVNADWGSTETPGTVMQSNQSEAAVLRRYAYATQTRLLLNMGNVVKESDVNSIIGIRNALIDLTTHRVRPLWVHLFSDEQETARLMDWINLGTWSRTYFSYLLNSGIAFEFDEVVEV